MAIAAGLAKKAELLDSFRREYGQQIDGRWWYSIVPLMPQLRTEIAVPPREGFRTTEARLEQVADAATNRLKAVLHAFVRQPGEEHGGWSFLISAIFDLGGASKIRSFILDKLKSELRRSGQL
ncbi:MAG TPA: hypothetical protein VHB50_08435 [Bryobacteraceae bacterium]|nr:hypothetical protein [Bryobacteraceae bacterium]